MVSDITSNIVPCPLPFQHQCRCTNRRVCISHNLAGEPHKFPFGRRHGPKTGALQQATDSFASTPPIQSVLRELAGKFNDTPPKQNTGNAFTHHVSYILWKNVGII